MFTSGRNCIHAQKAGTRGLKTQANQNTMKKTLTATLALTSLAMAASDILTLTPTYTTEDGTKHDMVDDYINRDNGSPIMDYFQGDGVPGYTLTSLEFTMTVKDLMGVNSVADTDILTLQSLTYYGQTQKYFVGGGRYVQIKVNGTDKTVSVPLSSQTNHGITLDYSLVETPLTFTKNDVLTFTWDSTSDEEGLSASILIDNKNKNPQVAGISKATGFTGFEKPVYMVAQIGVRVTSVPEPATATLSLLAIAGLASRRRRK